MRVSPRASRDGRVPLSTDPRRRYRHVGTVCNVVRSFCFREVDRHFDRRGAHQKSALWKKAQSFRKLGRRSANAGGARLCRSNVHALSLIAFESRLWSCLLSRALRRRPTRARKTKALLFRRRRRRKRRSPKRNARHDPTPPFFAHFTRTGFGGFSSRRRSRRCAFVPRF